MSRPTLRVQISSGEEIVQGHLFLADADGPCPTAILVPGWPGNPDDVLGLGDFLSTGGVHVLVFNPRGFHASSGTATMANTLEDIAAVIHWVRSHSDTHGMMADSLFLGGHSFGGGMALAYAAQDSTIRRLISISSTDHGQFIRKYQQDRAFASMADQGLASTLAPTGLVRADIGVNLQELAEHQGGYGLQENAAALADRRILLVGGWDDQSEPLEESLLPVYRALRAAGAERTTVRVLHADHQFGAMRKELGAAVLEWILDHAAWV